MSITLVIVIITALISFQAFNNQGLFNKLKHFPYVEQRQGEWYRLLTSGFVHADWIHLGINMFVFYEFGRLIEQLFIQESLFGPIKGRIVFILLYLLGIVFASLPSFAKHKDNPHYSAIGASGAVSGILFAYIIFFPWSTLRLYGIIPIPAIIAGIAYLVYSSWAGKKGGDNIGHDAHFYGALFGFIFTILMKPSLFLLFINQLINNFPLLN